MTSNELYNSVIEQLKIHNMHPLHKAMLDECCENALQNKQGITEKDTLMFAVQVGFVSANALLQGTLKAALAIGDQVTLNYRGQTFIIPKDSPLLKQATT